MINQRAHACYAPNVRRSVENRIGPRVSFGDDAVRFHTQVVTGCDVLPEGYDGSWPRQQPAT